MYHFSNILKPNEFAIGRKKDERSAADVSRTFHSSLIIVRSNVVTVAEQIPGANKTLAEQVQTRSPMLNVAASFDGRSFVGHNSLEESHFRAQSLINIAFVQ